MACTTHTIDARPPRGNRQTLLGNAFLGAATVIGGLFRRWHEHHTHSNAIRRLHALDDRMLKDIGLERSQIASAVRFGGPRSRRR